MMLIHLNSVESCPHYFVDAAGKTRQLFRFEMDVRRPSSDRQILHVVLRKPDDSVVTAPIAFYQLPLVFLWIPMTGNEPGRMVPAELVIGSAEEKFRFDISLSFGRSPMNLLRLDKLAGIIARWSGRPASADIFQGLGFSADLPAYLAQHSVVYERAVDDWMDGQVVGNGDLTGIILNHGTTEIHLTKSDLWPADKTGRALGRVSCGTITISPENLTAAGTCRQSMHIDTGMVVTEYSTGGFSLRTESWMDPVENVLFTSVRGSTRRPVQLVVGLRRNRLPPETLLRQDGTRPPYVREYSDFILDKTLEARRDGDVIGLFHPFPNMAYAVACRLIGISGLPETEQDDRSAGATFRVRVETDFDFTIAAAVVTRRGWGMPGETGAAVFREAVRLLRSLDPGVVPERKTRAENYWKAFWRQGPFVQMEDAPFMENLWYVSIYHAACVRGRDVAPSFLGAWWCDDLVPWRDNYVADSQVQEDSWMAFSTGHLELFLPFLSMFGRLMPFFMAHASAEGIDGGVKVPHMYFPEHGMVNLTDHSAGKGFPGSTPWIFQNFIWFHEYTGDREYLECFLYPALVMVHRYIRKVLLAGGVRGKLHVLGDIPEQYGTGTDNPFNIAVVRMVYEKLSCYAGMLGRKEEQREYRNILRRLPEYPQNATEIFESAEQTHPFRKHPSVFFPVFPGDEVGRGHPLMPKFRKTFRRMLRFWASRYDAVVNDGRGRNVGGAEPNGHSVFWDAAVAARMGDAQTTWGLLYNPAVLLLLKPQGLFAHGGRKSHPWYKTALLDASHGFVLAVNEAMLGSGKDGFTLFPAVPKTWTGRFANLLLPGPLSVSSEMIRGRVSHLVIESGASVACRFLNPWPGEEIVVEELCAHTARRIGPTRFVRFQAHAGCRYRMTAGRHAFPPQPYRIPSEERRNEPRILPLSAMPGAPRRVYFPDTLNFQTTGQDWLSGNAVTLGIPGRGVLPLPGRNIFQPNGKEFRRLMQGNWQERQSALAGLTTEACVAKKAFLIKALGDSHELVRWTAAHKLALIATLGKGILPVLIQLLESRELQNRWVAITALEQVAHTTFGYDLQRKPSEQKRALDLWRQFGKRVSRTGRYCRADEGVSGKPPRR